MSKRILIVDDEPELIEIISLMFQKAQWQTESAPNGLVALQKMKIFSPDVILSDIHMPEMDGLALLEELDWQGNSTPLIFLSSFGSRSYMVRAWGNGAFDFLDKPFNEKTMVQLAENAYLYGRDYVTAARRRYLKFNSTTRIAN